MSHCAREERETCIKGRTHAWNVATMQFSGLIHSPRVQVQGMKEKVTDLNSSDDSR